MPYLNWIHHVGEWRGTRAKERTVLLLALVSFSVWWWWCHSVLERHSEEEAAEKAELETMAKRRMIPVLVVPGQEETGRGLGGYEETGHVRVEETGHVLVGRTPGHGDCHSGLVDPPFQHHGRRSWDKYDPTEQFFDLARPP